MSGPGPHVGETELGAPRSRPSRAPMTNTVALAAEYWSLTYLVRRASEAADRLAADPALRAALEAADPEDKAGLGAIWAEVDRLRRIRAL